MNITLNLKTTISKKKKKKEHGRVKNVSLHTHTQKKKSVNKIVMISAKEDSVGPFQDIHYVDCKLSIDYSVFYYYRFFFPIVDMFVEKKKLKLKG